jgi:hypothetical protein
LAHRVILDPRRAPRGVHGRIAVDAELHHEVRHHAKEACVVEVTVLHEIVETVCPIRRPVALHFDDERPLVGFEFCLVGGGRLLVECGRVGKFSLTECRRNERGERKRCAQHDE